MQIERQILGDRLLYFMASTVASHTCAFRTAISFELQAAGLKPTPDSLNYNFTLGRPSWEGM
jgi:hypothetical protein